MHVTSDASFEERRLFHEIAEGDETAYRQLVSIYVPLLGPMIYGIVKSQLVVDDIIQETLVRIWIHRDQLPEIERPRSWILRIAYLQSLTHLRSQKVKQKAFDNISKSTEKENTETEDWLATRNIKALIAESVQQLPPQQKKIYRLSREGGLSPGEIAQELKLSEQTVKNTLVTALKSIRAYLARSGYTFLCLLFLEVKNFF